MVDEGQEGRGTRWADEGTNLGESLFVGNTGVLLLVFCDSLLHVGHVAVRRKDKE